MYAVLSCCCIDSRRWMDVTDKLIIALSLAVCLRQTVFESQFKLFSFFGQTTKVSRCVDWTQPAFTVCICVWCMDTTWCVGM